VTVPGRRRRRPGITRRFMVSSRASSDTGSERVVELDISESLGESDSFPGSPTCCSPEEVPESISTPARSNPAASTTARAAGIEVTPPSRAELRSHLGAGFGEHGCEPAMARRRIASDRHGKRRQDPLGSDGVGCLGPIPERAAMFASPLRPSTKARSSWHLTRLTASEAAAPRRLGAHPGPRRKPGLERGWPARRVEAPTAVRRERGSIDTDSYRAGRDELERRRRSSSFCPHRLPSSRKGP